MTSLTWPSVVYTGGLLSGFLPVLEHMAFEYGSEEKACDLLVAWVGDNVS